ncbi:MAG: T9SS type A sorting domain-containing protein, partial [Cyclobacteriaceae bacterium]|nr:T9SS type A sorting domain-containing protein [Cyclobacteriaceae bacterium]
HLATTVDFQVPFGFDLTQWTLKFQEKDQVYRKIWEEGTEVTNLLSINAKMGIKQFLPPFSSFIPQDTWTAAATKPYYSPIVDEADDHKYYGEGDLYIYYGYGHGNHIRNPLVIVEGIDGDNYLYDWKRFYLMLGHEKMEQLRLAGFDMIFVNFKDGATFVQRNAFMFESALAMVNQSLLSNGSNESITLIGISMGGVVTRYALADLEKSGIDHNVKTWFSFDSPQQGANIPIGLQQFMKYFGHKVYDNAGKKWQGLFQDAKDGWDYVNKIAPKQLLFHHVSGSTNVVASPSPLHDQLYDLELLSLGYPKEVKRVGISNGNGFGLSQMSTGLWPPQRMEPGDQLIEMDTHDLGNILFVWFLSYKTAISRLEFSVWAEKAESQIQTFDGKFETTLAYNIIHGPEDWDKSWNGYSNVSVAYDHVPGGYRNSIEKLDLDGILGFAYSAFHNHCFIPTVSALDIRHENGVPYSPEINVYSTLVDEENGNPSLSPFDFVRFANENEGHVEFTNVGDFLNKQLLPENLVFARNMVFSTHKSYVGLSTAQLAGTSARIELSSSPSLTFDVTSSGDISVEAGSCIKLEPGFHAAAGSNFHSKINPALLALIQTPSSSAPQVTSAAKSKSSVNLADEAPKDTSGTVELAKNDVLPSEYSLLQNYPNPFNPTTTLRYALKEDGRVSLKIYNILGQEIRSLVKEYQAAGYKSVVWDGKNNSGNQVPSGIYIYRLQAGTFVQTRKMMMLK